MAGAGIITLFGRDFRAGAKAGGLGFRGLGPPVFHLAGAGIITLFGRDFRACAKAGGLGFRDLVPPRFSFGWCRDIYAAWQPASGVPASSTAPTSRGGGRG